MCRDSTPGSRDAENETLRAATSQDDNGCDLIAGCSEPRRSTAARALGGPGKLYAIATLEGAARAPAVKSPRPAHRPRGR